MSKLPQYVIKLAAVGLVGFALPTAGIAAPAVCGDRGALIKTLKTKYKEVPSGMGISLKSTEAFEVFTSKNGTWTVIMTTSTGRTCIMAAGHSWKDIPRASTDPQT